MFGFIDERTKKLRIKRNRCSNDVQMNTLPVEIIIELRKINGREKYFCLGRVSHNDANLLTS
jgi:hypothetical protein